MLMVSSDWIHLDGVSLPKKELRAMRKRIEKWMALHPEFQRPGVPRCELDLKRAPFERAISCSLLIRWGSDVWAAAWQGRSVHQALVGCLENLKMRVDPIPQQAA